MTQTQDGRLEVESIRNWFPALAGDTVFLENAGGSQVPGVVADAIRDYMLESYVQLGAGYPLSDRATKTVADAHAFIETFMHAGDAGRVILGSSSTALCMMLANCYRPTMRSGDEIVIAACGHETNVGPWVRLAEATGAKIVWWKPDVETTSTTIDTLGPLLNERTRFVALPHVSNLLGEILDIAGVVEAAHSVGARVVADGVAYAPHRAIDVSTWGVDYYFYSLYKVYGPHMGALFGRHEALEEITGPNHFFIPDGEVPYKFEPGGVCHEHCAGVLALEPYLRVLSGARDDAPFSHAIANSAATLMADLELPMQERLVTWLSGRPGVRIIGPGHGGRSRVGTISFIHESIPSRDIAAHVNGQGIGIRHGHMYAYRLCQALKIDPEDGVVRVSLVHYNTMDEIDRLIHVLESVI